MRANDYTMVDFLSQKVSIKTVITLNFDLELVFSRLHAGTVLPKVA